MKNRTQLSQQGDIWDMWTLILQIIHGTTSPKLISTEQIHYLVPA